MLVSSFPADSLLTTQQYRTLPNAMLWFSVCYFLLYIQVE